MKKIIIFNFFLFIAFLFDRISKWLAQHVLSSDGIYVVPNVFGVVFERNQGIAYSIFLPRNLLMIAVSIISVALVFLAVRSYRRQELAISFALSLIIVGAFSNFLDRLRYGYVVDMFVLTGWPVFNLADIMIIAGAIWILWRVARTKRA